MSTPADPTPAPSTASGAGLREDDLHRLQVLWNACQPWDWRYQNGEISDHYVADGEPVADIIACGIATGLSDPPVGEFIALLANMSARLIVSALSARPPRTPRGAWSKPFA